MGHCAATLLFALLSSGFMREIGSEWTGFRSTSLSAEQRLAALKAGGHNVLVQYPLEQVMHWHFVAMISRISRKLCRKRAQGGWRC